LDRKVRPWDRKVLTGSLPQDQGSPQADGVHVSRTCPICGGGGLQWHGLWPPGSCFCPPPPPKKKCWSSFPGPRAPFPLASVGGGWRGSITRRVLRAGPSGALTSKGGNPAYNQKKMVEAPWAPKKMLGLRGTAPTRQGWAGWCGSNSTVFFDALVCAQLGGCESHFFFFFFMRGFTLGGECPRRSSTPK
jgi:hypothetical protein